MGFAETDHLIAALMPLYKFKYHKGGGIASTAFLLFGFGLSYLIATILTEDERDKKAYSKDVIYQLSHNPKPI